METDFTRQRLFNKAHIFDEDAEFCARCGANVTEALNTPFRCTGQRPPPPRPRYPTTLTAAIDSAEDHIAARRAAVKKAALSKTSPSAEDGGASIPTMR